MEPFIWNITFKFLEIISCTNKYWTCFECVANTPTKFNSPSTKFLYRCLIDCSLIVGYPHYRKNISTSHSLKESRNRRLDFFIEVPSVLGSILARFTKLVHIFTTICRHWSLHPFLITCLMNKLSLAPCWLRCLPLLTPIWTFRYQVYAKTLCLHTWPSSPRAGILPQATEIGTKVGPTRR